MNDYTATIGIETHVQLKTKTKLFSAVDNDARDAEPNTKISAIDLGLPGILPVLNEKAVELAVRVGIALNAEIGLKNKFDRKHYFYPDLPKGYQITQYDEPIVRTGYVDITLPDGTTKRIGVERAHLEEDAGKSTHPAGQDYSLVDLNRAGTPLMEIVSKPDMHTSAEAKAYAEELYVLMRYAEVSDCNLYYGNMRFDVNVSVSKDSSQLGTRTETKNLNSFRSVEKAVEYEIKRQIEVLERGEPVVQETRGWDDAKQQTFSQRSKEEAHDYRYFPEPDIPPLELTEEYIDEVKSTMPMMPTEIRRKLAVLSLQPSHVETLLMQPKFVELLLGCVDNVEHAKRIANWLIGPVQEKLSNNEWTEERLNLDKEAFIKLSVMVADNKLSSSAAKEVLIEMVEKGGDASAIAETKNLLQVSDTSELEAIVKKILQENEQAAADVKNGEHKAIGFLVGQVMKASQGKANPQVVAELIKKHLS